MAGDRVLLRRIVLLALVPFATAASTRVADPLLPQLAERFAISTAEAARTVSAFALAYGILQLFFGPLGDRYGKFHVITFATLACILAAGGCAVAMGFDSLVLFRALNGMTAAGLSPLAMAWISDNVPYANRQKVLAHFLTGQIFGVISGQLLGGVFADLTGWRGAFVCVALIYLAVGILLVRELRRSPDIDGSREAKGSGVGFASAVLSILRLRWARIILFCIFSEGALFFGALAFTPTYLHQRFGISLSLAGAAIGAFGIGGLVYTGFARYFLARMNERQMGATSGIIGGLAFLLLPLGPHWLWVIPCVAAVGFSLYMLHNTLQVNASQMAPASRGTATALFASCFFLGQSAGVGLASVVIAQWGVHAVFIASAALLPLVGAFFAWKLASREPY